MGGAGDPVSAEYPLPPFKPVTGPYIADHFIRVYPVIDELTEKGLPLGIDSFTVEELSEYKEKILAIAEDLPLDEERPPLELRVLSDLLFSLHSILEGAERQRELLSGMAEWCREQRENINKYEPQGLEDS